MTPHPAPIEELKNQSEKYKSHRIPPTPASHRFPLVHRQHGRTQNFTELNSIEIEQHFIGPKIVQLQQSVVQLNFDLGFGKSLSLLRGKRALKSSQNEFER